MNNWLVMIVLFGSVSVAGILTLVFNSFFSKIKQYVTTIGVSFVLSLICIHILPELFANTAPNLGVKYECRLDLIQKKHQ